VDPSKSGEITSSAPWELFSKLALRSPGEKSLSDGRERFRQPRPSPIARGQDFKRFDLLLWGELGAITADAALCPGPRGNSLNPPGRAVRVTITNQG